MSDFNLAKVKAKRLELTTKLEALNNHLTNLREDMQNAERAIDQIVGGIRALTELIDDSEKKDDSVN